MRFLIDTLEGEPLEADMIDDMLESFSADDVLYVDGVLCRLSTARSMEEEAVREATAIIQQGIELFHDADKLREWEGVQAWLEKWGRK